MSGYESEPRLVAVAARVDRLTHDLFVADAAYAHIKWFDHRDDTLKQVYRAECGARVHNALLPDARRLDQFAIDSLDNSGHNKAETRFRLLRLRWTIKKEEESDEEKEKKKVEEKEILNVKLAEEFYRVDSEQLDAIAQHTSLCLAGGHVLCSVTRSRRLVAFKYQNENEGKEKKKMESNEPLPYNGTTLTPCSEEKLLDAPREPEVEEINVQSDDDSSLSSGNTDFGSRPEMFDSQQSFASVCETSIVPERAQFDQDNHVANASRLSSSSMLNLDRRIKNTRLQTENKLLCTKSLGELNSYS